MIDTWVELAWQDASVGWIGIANFPSAAVSAAYLPDEGFYRSLHLDHGNRVTMGGQFFPQRRGRDGRRRVPVVRLVEFRLGNGALRICGRRLHPEGRAATMVMGRQRAAAAPRWP